MKSKRWTPDEDAVIRQLYGKVPVKQIAEQLGRSYGSLVVRANRIGYRTRSYYTMDEIRLIVAEYPNTPTKILAAKLGKPWRRVEQWAKNNGICKSDEYRAALWSKQVERLMATGGATRFEKGLTPWNKGKPFTVPEACKATQFKPGQKPWKTKPVGAERVNFAGHVEIKVQEDGTRAEMWRKKTVVLWEAAHGPIPDGYIVVCRNGDQRDVRLDNLELITLHELRVRTHYTTKYPVSLVEVIQARGVLTRTINNKRGRQSHEKSASRFAGSPV